MSFKKEEKKLLHPCDVAYVYVGLTGVDGTSCACVTIYVKKSLLTTESFCKFLAIP